jgi:hypothetical protein
MQPETAYPVDLKVDYPERRSRWLAILEILFILPIVKSILLIPHIIVLFILVIVYGVTTYIAHWAVLFIGRYPKGLFDFNVGVMRWSSRVSVYSAGLTYKYPPFGMK